MENKNIDDRGALRIAAKLRSNYRNSKYCKEENVEIKTLQPNQIMTLNDFPVHNEQILQVYFEACQKGHPEILPPVPVIHKSTGIPLLKGDSKEVKRYNALILKYFEENPQVEYILVDGSHKTTALTLTHNPIHVMVLKTDKDVKEVRKLIKQGKVFSLTAADTIEDILRENAEHFFEAEFFQTVEDKTKRMVQEKVIPQYMIDSYNKK